MMSNSLLKTLKIGGFKCFKEALIPLKKLTVLTGLNGGGKSTVLQSILLFSQTVREMELYGEKLLWPLNGDFINLGTFGEVLNSELNDTHISFEYQFTDRTKPFAVKLTAEPGERNLQSDQLQFENISEKFNQIKRIQYLGPVRNTNGETISIPNHKDYYRVGLGTDGRYAGYWLYKNSEQKVLKGQLFDNEVSNFRMQANNWLNYIATGTGVTVQPTADTHSLALKFHQFGSGKFHSIANIGFGVTCVFPIIISMLCAKKGDIILIDSPEAHLHPRAQSRVGRMIAKFAAFGIQIILETHSEHILNGIRIAVMEEVLKPSVLNVLFFSDGSFNNSQVTQTPINKHGQIENWPEGFFDQIDNDLLTLIEGR